MNFIKMAKLLGTAVRPKAASAEMAKSITKRSIAKNIKPKPRTYQADPSFDANVLDTMAVNTMVPSPSEVSFARIPKTTLAERQIMNDEKFGRDLFANQQAMEPMLRTQRNINFGLGAVAGSVPPGILALYLLAQEEENKKKRSK